MFTVCPKCALTLVVTAADLRAAQGYVRCGRCSNIFNATAALVDDVASAAPPLTPPAPAPAALLEPQPQPTSAPQPEVVSDEAAMEFDPAATNVADIFIEPRLDEDAATGSFEAVVLETGEPDPTGSDLPPPATSHAPIPMQQVDEEAEEIEEELRSLVQRLEAQEAATEPAAPLGAITQTSVPTGADASKMAGENFSEDEEENGRSWPWGVSAAVLAIVLALQMVHRYRNELATHPQLNTSLTKIYGALGLALEPHWDVRAYEVRQLGADAASAGAGQLIVRASVKNSAPRAQPLPLLRVAVLDRFGNRIAARDVTAAAYLPRGVATDTPLRAGQRIDAQLSFVDPGSDAVGFEIDACLASRDGSVVCANSLTR